MAGESFGRTWYKGKGEIIEQETRECIKTSIANIVQNSIETIVSTVKNNLLEKFLKQKKLEKISVKKGMDKELADYSNSCWDVIIAWLVEEEVKKKVSQKEINQDVLEGIKIQLAKARKRKK
jgi:glycyl-tRNA synthetase (class II)